MTLFDALYIVAWAVAGWAMHRARQAKRENARLTDELRHAQQSKTGACWAAYCRGVGFGYELAGGQKDPSLHSASYATIDELIGRHTVEES